MAVSVSVSVFVSVSVSVTVTVMPMTVTVLVAAVFMPMPMPMPMPMAVTVTVTVSVTVTVAVSYILKTIIKSYVNLLVCTMMHQSYRDPLYCFQAMMEKCDAPKLRQSLYASVQLKIALV